MGRRCTEAVQRVHVAGVTNGGGLIQTSRLPCRCTSARACGDWPPDGCARMAYITDRQRPVVVGHADHAAFAIAFFRAARSAPRGGGSAPWRRFSAGSSLRPWRRDPPGISGPGASRAGIISMTLLAAATNDVPRRSEIARESPRQALRDLDDLPLACIPSRSHCIARTGTNFRPVVEVRARRTTPRCPITTGTSLYASRTPRVHDHGAVRSLQPSRPG